MPSAPESRPVARLAVLLGVVATLAGAAPAPAAGPVRVERERFLMGTRCTLLLEGEDATLLADAATAAFESIARDEERTSNWRDTSELSRLNAGLAEGGPVPVSPATFALLEAAGTWWARSGGAFDATVEALTRLYDLRGAGRFPGEAELARARTAVGGGAVELDASTRTVRSTRAGLAFDLGGIAKGAAIDRAVAVLRDRDVTRGLLNLGGQVYALGAPAGAAGWTIELADPRDRRSVVATVELRDRSLATSGASERGLRVAGRLLHHVLDPRSGRPAADWGAAVAIASSALDADAASTALAVLGPGDGRAWIERQDGLEGWFLVVDAGAANGLRLDHVPGRAVAAGAPE